MRTPTWVWPDRAERWRKPVLVAMSLALHAAVLGYIALRAFDATEWALQPPDDLFVESIPVELVPRPLMPGEQARVRPAPAPAAARPTVALPGSPTAPRDLPFHKPDDDDDDRPTAPVPHIAAPAAAGAPAPPAGVAVDPWAVRPESLGDRVARTLRHSSIGCATPNLLTARERDDCDQRLADAAARTPPITAAGDSRFAREGARALARYEERRRPLAGGTGVVGPQDGPGSNFGMGVAGANLDPSLRPDSTQNIHTRRDER